ncbi:MAG: hypothetical protein M3O30_04530 [Planctomycetota bacterium]|nr:hypothetical protein [Planctomycetota bacterium]
MNTAEALTWLGTITGAVGAATGISSLGISFWTIRRDRPQLAAKLQRGYKVSENVGDYRTEYTYILITVSNRGRRPAAIGKIWFTQRDSTKSILVIDALRAGTVELPEGRAKDYLVREDNLDASSLEQLFVEDGAGRRWVGNPAYGTWVKLRVLSD